MSVSSVIKQIKIPLLFAMSSLFIISVGANDQWQMTFGMGVSRWNLSNNYKGFYLQCQTACGKNSFFEQSGKKRIHVLSRNMCMVCTLYAGPSQFGYTVNHRLAWTTMWLSTRSCISVVVFRLAGTALNVVDFHTIHFRLLCYLLADVRGKTDKHSFINSVIPAEDIRRLLSSATSCVFLLFSVAGTQSTAYL